MASDPRGTALMVELMAAANHRPVLREVVGQIAQRVRAMQLERLETLLPEHGLAADRLPPALVAASTQGPAFGIVQEEEGGYDTRPDEAREAMQALIEALERGRTRRVPRRRLCRRLRNARSSLAEPSRAPRAQSRRRGINAA
jgi:hypothetical protein